ncbi:MAG: HigA family addiction module antidote protein [Acidobacteriia bacterium]|nr:HigA family addiction module antidote protein [Terriglobia bacterium]
MARTPIHPGEILADELKEIGISAAELARTLEVPANRISQITARKRAISADTALRLARYFGTTPDLWMNLQKTYELDLARQQLGKGISHIPQRPDALAPSAAIEPPLSSPIR